MELIPLDGISPITAHTHLIGRKVVIIKDGGAHWRRKWIDGNRSPSSLSFRPNQLLSLSPPRDACSVNTTAAPSPSFHCLRRLCKIKATRPALQDKGHLNREQLTAWLGPRVCACALQCVCSHHQESQLLFYFLFILHLRKHRSTSVLDGDNCRCGTFTAI